MEVTINGVEYESKSTGNSFYECEKCAFYLGKGVCESVYIDNNRCTDLSSDKYAPIYWVKKEAKKNPHPHAALMLEYAKDMAEDSSILWEFNSGNGWVDTKIPLWNITKEYRRKPKEPTLKTEYFCLYKVGNIMCFSSDEKLTKNVEAVFNEDNGELISIKMI